MQVKFHLQKAPTLSSITQGVGVGIVLKIPPFSDANENRKVN